jgi:hypothetical protein
MDEASIRASINHGYPDLGMPSFASLPEADVNAILDYIRARRSAGAAAAAAKRQTAAAPTAKIPQGVVRTERASFRLRFRNRTAWLSCRTGGCRPCDLRTIAATVVDAFAPSAEDARQTLEFADRGPSPSTVTLNF